MNDTQAAEDLELGTTLLQQVLGQQPTWVEGDTLIEYGRTLFQWQDFTGDGEQVDVSFINLDNVSVVHMLGDVLKVRCGDQQSETDDPDTIARFWAEFEVI